MLWSCGQGMESSCGHADDALISDLKHDEEDYGFATMHVEYRQITVEYINDEAARRAFFVVPSDGCRT